MAQTRAKTLTAAAKDGDRLAELKAMRRILAESIQGAKAKGSFKDISPLSGKLIELGREIEELEVKRRKAEEESIPDAIFDASTI